MEARKTCEKQNLDRIVVVDENVVFDKVDDVYIMLDLKTGVYFKINETGVAVWKILQERSCRIREIVNSIADAYSIDQTDCETDVSEYLEQLHDKGFIHFK